MKAPRNFKEAAIAALNERWYPMCNAKTIYEMINITINKTCALCVLQRRRGFSLTQNYEPFYKKRGCGKCPLNDGRSGGRCCREWQEWFKAVNHDMFDVAHNAACKLVVRLEKIGGKNE